MADESTDQEGTNDEPAKDAPATGDADALGDAGKKALDVMKAERNAATSELKALKRELDKVRQSSMSDADKAVTEAEARGRSAALSEFGSRLATAEFRAAAAASGRDAEGLLDLIDVRKFVADGGEPDTDAIKAAVERLPAKSSGQAPPTPSFDGGARQAAKTSQVDVGRVEARKRFGDPANRK